MGYNPYRKFKAKPADYVFVAAALVVSLGLARLGPRRLTIAAGVRPRVKSADWSEGVDDQVEVGAGDRDDVEADRVGVDLVGSEPLDGELTDASLLGDA